METQPKKNRVALIGFEKKSVSSDMNVITAVLYYYVEYAHFMFKFKLLNLLHNNIFL